MNNQSLKVAVIGTGYVGLPTSVGLAELGNNLVCIDRDQRKIDNLKAGNITLFEENLEELFLKNVKKGRISFTSSMQEGIKDAQVIILAVGTPPHPITKEADMKYLHAAAVEVANYLPKDSYTVIIIKSTVPVGTGDDIEQLIAETNPNAQFDVVSLPEFLREGYALYDFFHPERIIIGANNDRPVSIIKKLYSYFEDKTEFLCVKRQSSETIKYASNAFLAMKLHYVNEIANFCEKTGADVEEVTKGMGLDSRIGSRFLKVGPGYGGSCFPKDTLALSHMARKNEVTLSLVNTVIAGNATRKQEIATKILRAVKDIEHPNIAILGLAFKDATDDCRESPAIDVIGHLLEKRVNIKVYDPQAMENAKELLGIVVKYADNMNAVADDADVLVILTEWANFTNLDYNYYSKVMRNKRILDYRNLLNPDNVPAEFMYERLG